MSPFNCLHSTICVSIFALLLGFASLSTGEEVLIPTFLSNKDCQKCHPNVKQTITLYGGAHRDKTQCKDCHADHPPWGENVSPDCHQCHNGSKHLDLGSCLQCHADPHAPLELCFEPNICAPCLTCHPLQGKEFNRHFSQHAKLPCSQCHIKHGYIPVCTDCHNPHVAGQLLQDCLSCHSGHRPLNIHYPLDTPSAVCDTCHPEFIEKIGQHESRHTKMTCAFCHRNTHGVIPQCRTCHREPHEKVMHVKWPVCTSCHHDPHDIIL